MSDLIEKLMRLQQNPDPRTVATAGEAIARIGKLEGERDKWIKAHDDAVDELCAERDEALAALTRVREWAEQNVQDDRPDWRDEHGAAAREVLALLDPVEPRP